MISWTTSGGYEILKILSGRSNVFLLRNCQSSVLIDTSAGFMWKALQRNLDRLRIDRIDLLILTHSHFDHAANAHKIREKYNAKVIIHKSEAGYLLTGTNILPTGTNPITRFIVRVFARQFISFARYQPCGADLAVDRSFDLSGYGLNAYLMHTPGHTKGSLSLIIDNEIAIVGDTMFGIFPRTIYPPFASDTRQMIQSWEKLLNTKCTVFLPSHGSANKRSLVEKDFIKYSTAGI